MSRYGLWTKVAKFRAMNMVAIFRVAWIKKLPGVTQNLLYEI